MPKGRRSNAAKKEQKKQASINKAARKRKSKLKAPSAYRTISEYLPAETERDSIEKLLLQFAQIESNMEKQITQLPLDANEKRLFGQDKRLAGYREDIDAIDNNFDHLGVMNIAHGLDK
jgi:hypothetical protein